VIDIGVNLLHEQFDGDREAVVERAWQAGLEHMIITGTDVASSRAAAAYVADRPDGGFSATAGIHPHAAAAAAPGWRDELTALAAQGAVVAIGETGLDFNRNFSPPDIQEHVFREHLALARALHLPVFVHDRDASELVAQCLSEQASMEDGVVVHCFTGSRSALHQYLDLGCHIGITGWVCDRRRGSALRELITEIPLQRLMIETDAPYLKPHNAQGTRGRRNEPALLPWVATQLAELYGMDKETLQTRTAANARAFFRLPPA
jgi:TatD DNase family protein